MFWKGRGPDATASVVVPFDADRPAVEAAKRDLAAFEPLYRKYVSHIYSLALYETRDPHAAEDLTEQVFLRVLDALPRFREQGEGSDSTFRVWLYQVARNVIANERRRQRRHPEDAIDAALEIAAPDDPAATALTRVEARRAWQAVRELSPDGARPSSCASSTSSARERSVRSWVDPRLPSACSSIAP